jgi:hypothetical protein
MKTIELALVARVGSRRAPVILASLRDERMLVEALRQAVRVAGVRTRTDDDRADIIPQLLRGNDNGRVI